MNKYTKTLTRGLLAENPTLRLVLGTCPTLAVTTTVLGGLGMGVAATFVLICSNVAVSLLRNIIPEKVRLPAYIVLIATFTTVVQLLVKAFMPVVDEMLGIYLPLIVVNCILLGRAEAFASKNPVGLSALDGVGMGGGFTAALVLMGAVRELLGNGTLFGWPDGGLFPAMTVFVMPAGGFFVFGMMIWLTNRLVRKVEGENAPVADSVCGGCPHADTCAQKEKGGEADD